MLTSSQTDGPDPEMSVPQKLAAAEDEARAARKERESRKRSRPDKTSTRGNRRRSTLTNDELEDLMGVPSR